LSGMRAQTINSRGKERISANRGVARTMQAGQQLQCLYAARLSDSITAECTLIEVALSLRPSLRKGGRSEYRVNEPRQGQLGCGFRFIKGIIPGRQRRFEFVVFCAPAHGPSPTCIPSLTRQKKDWVRSAKSGRGKNLFFPSPSLRLFEAYPSSPSFSSMKLDAR
jgi:hypothetical protein